MIKDCNWSFDEAPFENRSISAFAAGWYDSLRRCARLPANIALVRIDLSCNRFFFGISRSKSVREATLSSRRQHPEMGMSSQQKTKPEQVSVSCPSIVTGKIRAEFLSFNIADASHAGGYDEGDPFILRDSHGPGGCKRAAHSL